MQCAVWWLEASSNTPPLTAMERRAAPPPHPPHSPRSPQRSVAGASEWSAGWTSPVCPPHASSQQQQQSRSAAARRRGRRGLHPPPALLCLPRISAAAGSVCLLCAQRVGCAAAFAPPPLPPLPSSSAFQTSDLSPPPPSSTPLPHRSGRSGYVWPTTPPLPSTSPLLPLNDEQPAPAPPRHTAGAADTAAPTLLATASPPLSCLLCLTATPFRPHVPTTTVATSSTARLTSSTPSS